MTDALLIRHDAGSIARLTLNAPLSLNALSDAMLAALAAELTALATDATIRIVILQGAGKAFCAGHHLREMQAGRAHADQGRAYFADLFQRCAAVMQMIPALPQPVIAQVQGIATSAGCQLVAACDLAVAANTARFAVSGVNLGLFCSTPSVALSRNVGRKAAFEMLVTGDFISAEEAKQRGLVNRVAVMEALDAEVESLVAAIVAKPRVAIAMGKQLFHRQIETDVESAYEDAGRTMAANMMDASALEGVQAFIDKRKPSWSV